MQLGEYNQAAYEKEQQYKIMDDNGEESIINGDEIIKLPDGSLTTMYHYLKNSNKEIMGKIPLQQMVLVFSEILAYYS